MKQPKSRHPGGTPPVGTRFKPGISGNPNGRPKGSVNFLAQLSAELRSTITIQEGGRSRSVSKQEALIKQLVSKALQGEPRVFEKLIPLILTIGAEELTGRGDALTKEQKLILERNARRLLDSLVRKGGDQ